MAGCATGGLGSTADLDFELEGLEVAVSALGGQGLGLLALEAASRCGPGAGTRRGQGEDGGLAAKVDMHPTCLYVCDIYI